MENTTLEQNMGYSGSGLVIDIESKSYLETAAKWAYFLSILGFIIIAFVFVVGVFSSFVFGSAMSGLDDSRGIGQGLGALIGIFYILFGALYFFPVLFMFRFSSKMKRGLRENHQSLVTEGFKNLKNLYKFMGILTIVTFILYFLMFLSVGFFGAMSM